MATISLEKHLNETTRLRERYEDILRHAIERSEAILQDAERRHIEKEASWIKEKFDLHNNLLKAWQSSSAEDRLNFVKTATFEGFKDQVLAGAVSTAKALTLAAGKAEGYTNVRVLVGFVITVVVAIISTYLAVRGMR